MFFRQKYINNWYAIFSKDHSIKACSKTTPNHKGKEFYFNHFFIDFWFFGILEKRGFFVITKRKKKLQINFTLTLEKTDEVIIDIIISLISFEENTKNSSMSSTLYSWQKD